MKKILILVFVVFGFALSLDKKQVQEQTNEVKETNQVMQLGFENSGSPKSFEDDWGGF